MLLMPRPGDRGARPLQRRSRPSRSSARSPIPIDASSRTAATRAGSPDARRTYLGETGIADTAYFGPECEFFVFDEVSYELVAAPLALRRRLRRGPLELGGTPGLGYTVREKGGYFPPAPHDTLHDLRSEMVLTLERLGIPCEFHHHEVATAGQCEIDLRFQPLTRMADQVMTYKYVVRNVAKAAGKTRDLHAEADLRRQRLGDAHAPVALEGGRRR